MTDNMHDGHQKTTSLVMTIDTKEMIQTLTLMEGMSPLA